MKDYVVLNINGDDYKFSLGERHGQIPYSETLVQTLRDRIGLTGKFVRHCGRELVLLTRSRSYPAERVFADAVRCWQTGKSSLPV